MLKINENYLKVKESYLFGMVQEKANTYLEQNPDKQLIKMGIGDVTRALAPCVIQAMHKAIDEMADTQTFRGYGPSQGYDFLLDAITNFYKQTKNVDLFTDEIFVTDGAKSDVCNILDLFSLDNVVAMCDPVYPVYLEASIMAGFKPIFFNATKDNDFSPLPPKDFKADIIYLCNPNNPTGTVYNFKQLEKWVNYAIKNNAVILYDSAYEAYIDDPQEHPTSIYQIPGAKSCAIEFFSFSKIAGFTGIRCGYVVVPKELKAGNVSLNKLWARRQSAKFNGVNYMVQRGAEVALSVEGLRQNKVNIDYYKNNVGLITKTLDDLGIFYTGGKDSPYVWMQCQNKMESWDFFDYMLSNTGIIGTPGEGYGENGKNYFRLTGFNKLNQTLNACEKLKSLFSKPVL